MQLVLGSELATLWAGYGSIREGRLGKARVVCKVIRPPAPDGSVSQTRKLRSYEVESAFYRSGLPERLRRAGAHVALAVGDAPTERKMVLEDLRPLYPLTGVKKQGGEDEAKASLRWLARAHGETWRDPTLVDSLWEDGTFWRLDTRPDEYAAIRGTPMATAARAIDLRLRGFKKWLPRGDATRGLAPSGNWAMLHGDFKSTNLFYSNSGECAACDFQYCGPGAVVKDVAYHLVGSAHPSLLQKPGGDRALVDFYHAELIAANPAVATDGFTREQCWSEYRLAVADYTRWMDGWGSWGSARYASALAGEVLRDLRVDDAAAESDILERVWQLAPPC